MKTPISYFSPFVCMALTGVFGCGGDIGSGDIGSLEDSSQDVRLAAKARQCAKVAPSDVAACIGGDPNPPKGDTPSFAVLEALLQGKVTDGSINGYAVQIYDGDDSLLFESEAGLCESGGGACPDGNRPFTVDLVTGVASSSKWVTSTVLLAALDELVKARTLSTVVEGLDTTVGSVLGKQCGANRIGRGGQVTLRQLLSFTSGLMPDHPCVGNRAYDMKACACEILADSATREVNGPNVGTSQDAQPPGTVFKYGPAQQVVAAAMVEVATGESYDGLFQRLVRRPTGMSAAYQNPTEISGSLRASVRDYARFVRDIFHAGVPGGLLSAEALLEQEKNQFPEGLVRRSQLQPGLDYGLNTWRWCYRNTDAETLLAFGQDPDAFSSEEAQALQDSSCTEIHQQGHGGKGGYQPWVDRPRGFYGVFAMREPSPGGGDDYSASELSLTAFVRLYAGLVVEAMRAP
jgi:serine-type D-Ala-D-Ala carboxypeptidase/endopeptidase